MARTKLGTYRRARTVTRSIAEVIFRVRKYFEREKRLKHALNLNQILERTVEATGFSRGVVKKIKSQDDVDSWKYLDSDVTSYKSTKQVLDKYESLVRYAVRKLILEKIKFPTISLVQEKLQTLNVANVHHLNLFEDYEVPEESQVVWKWEGQLFIALCSCDTL